MIPPAVAEAAARSQFGQPVIAQKAPTRRTDIIRSLIFFGVGSLVVCVGLIVASTALDMRTLGQLFILPLAIGLVCLAMAVKVSLQQSQNYYLYQGGLVYQKGRRPLPIAWPEIAGLARQRGAANLDKAGKVSGALASTLEQQGIRRDSVLGYEVTLRTGRKLDLKVGNIVEEQARFGAHLEQFVAQAGIPITG
jgi:hypothetical protein